MLYTISDPPQRSELYKTRNYQAMTHDCSQLIPISEVRPIAMKVILGPDSLQDAPTKGQGSRAAHLVCPGDDIEDNCPLLIRPCLAVNDVNGELRFTGAQLGKDGKGLVEVLLHSDGLGEQAFKTAIQKQQNSELVKLRDQRRFIRNRIIMIICGCSYRQSPLQSSTSRKPL